MRFLRYLILLLTALMLMAPAVALAQSAGDQQYVDPLAGGTSSSGASGSSGTSNATNASGSSGTSSTGSGTSSGTGSSSGSGSSGSGTGANGTGSGSSGSGTGANGTGSGSGSLPYTGMDVWLVAIAGAGMLGGGFTVRRLAHRR